jgi:hypothetical protein
VLDVPGGSSPYALGPRVARWRGVQALALVALERIAAELLAREVLDADQVRRIVAGESLEAHKPSPTPASVADAARQTAKDRPLQIPQISKPLPQE